VKLPQCEISGEAESAHSGHEQHVQPSIGLKFTGLLETLLSVIASIAVRHIRWTFSPNKPGKAYNQGRL
jgi:hypothetical protein